MFGKLGAPEIILILVVIILLFGAKKLPDMARSLGKSARILKSEAKAMKSEGNNNAAAPSDPPAQDEQAQPARTIQAAPGDVTSSRPVTEPTNTSKS
ncbi:Sec-independent protein translocase subunit TatA [Streptomyces sp. NPDC057694]|uniref:Sec-independent protein translocase subunit TatA n=1 Tax=unclassified Streptomyces TaxID=2593676 RepID=UPI0036C51530